MQFHILEIEKCVLPAEHRASDVLLVISSYVKCDLQQALYYDANTISLKGLKDLIKERLGGKQAEGITFVSKGHDAFYLTKDVQAVYTDIQGGPELQNFWKDICGMIKEDGFLDLLVCNEGADVSANLKDYLDHLLRREKLSLNPAAVKKIQVKHEETIKKAQEAEDEQTTAAVVAFAISSRESDFPLDVQEKKEEKEETSGRFTDVIKALFGDKKKS